MSNRNIYIYIYTIIIITFSGIHIQLVTGQCYNNLNYIVYRDVNCTKPVAYVSTDYCSNAQYKTIFNGDEYYTIYSQNYHYSIIISNSNGSITYPLPVGTCSQGRNGYYYLIKATSNIQRSLDYPTLVYFTIQSSVCNVVSKVLTLPNNTVPSILGFIDTKYPMIDVKKELLNGTIFNCSECGNGRCMDTYQLVTYKEHDIKIQYNVIENKLIINNTGCSLFSSQVIIDNYIGIFTNTYLCNNVWNILPGQEDLIISSGWGSSDDYFPIESKIIEKRYIIPKLVYLTNTSLDWISFKVNTSLMTVDSNHFQYVSRVVEIPGIYFFESYSYIGDEYRIPRNYPNPVMVNITFGQVGGNIIPIKRSLCASIDRNISSFDITQRSTGFDLQTMYPFYYKFGSISIGDRYIFCGGYGFVSINSLQPNTMYTLRVAQSKEQSNGCTYQTVTYTNVTTLSGITTPLITSLTYQKQDLTNTGEMGNITITFNSTTYFIYGYIKYSISMNNRFIPNCIQILDNKCTFKPASPLIIDQEYKFKVTAYSDGLIKSTTYSLLLNQSNDIILKQRSPIPLPSQPTLPTLPPSPTPSNSPFQNITNNNTFIMNNHSTKNTSYNRIFLVVYIIFITIIW